MNHTIEQLRAVISYVPEDGTFIRKSGKKSVGTINDSGYKVIRVLEKTYHVHRLGWLLHYGTLPKMLDHINQDKADNRIVNLRIATPSENRSNSKVRSDSATGLKGVQPSGKKFMASVTKEGSRYYLGTYDTAHEAHCAYKGASLVLHGEFACHY